MTSRFDRLLGPLFILLALGGTALVLVREERRALDDPVQQGQRGEVTGIAGISLLGPANLRRALYAADARLADDEQVTSVRIEPTRLDVQARNTVGTQRFLQVGLDHRVHVTSTSGTSTATGPRGLTELDAAAPARLIRTVQAREGYPPDRIDYVVFSPASTPSRWDAFWTNVPIERNHFGADAHGRLLP